MSSFFLSFFLSVFSPPFFRLSFFLSLVLFFLTTRHRDQAPHVFFASFVIFFFFSCFLS